MEERTDRPRGGDPEAPGRAERELPLGMRLAAAWSWRLLLIGAALAAFLWVVVQLRIIVIPILIAILLTALLAPIVRWFERNGLPRWLGVLVALATFLAAVWLLVYLIVTELRDGYDDMARRSEQAWWDVLHWIEATFGISANELGGFVDQLLDVVERYQSQIWSGALGIATTFGQLITGLLLTVFSLIFMLLDGRRIWYWVLGFFPSRAHAPLDAAGRAGWVSVGQYVRVQIFVAFVDAVGIGVGAAVLGVPLAVPIAVLVFLGSFIPFLGAIATGALAAFIALVYNGPLNALLMLGVVILVQQLESHVLQPLVMGSAVKVHPLGVVLAVSAGALVAGIPGALFAVPLAASLNSIVNTLVRKKWDPSQDPVAEFNRINDTRNLARARARTVAKLRRKEGRS